MLIGFGSCGLLHVIFGCFPGLWTQSWFAAGYLILNPGALALGAVGFLSMGMKISWTKSVATMFTVYMTLSNVGHVVGNQLAPWLVEELTPWFVKELAPWLVVNRELSYEISFAVAGIATIAPLVLLAVVNPATVDAKRSEKP